MIRKTAFEVQKVSIGTVITPPCSKCVVLNACANPFS